MRLPRVRSVPARLVLALSIVASPALLVATPAGAATLVKLNLNSHAVTVQTSTGHTLKLTVAAFKDISRGNDDDIAVNVTLST